MALRAGAFPEKLGHSACCQPVCAGKDWCITHPIGQRCTDDQPTIKGRTSANFGYSKPLFACVHRTFGDQFIAPAHAIFFWTQRPFTPPIGPAVVEAVRRCTQKPLNVHLMIVEPERHLSDFAKAGADHLLVQAEPSATIHLHRVLSQIHDLGKKAGVVLDPASPTELIEYVLHLCDVVLVMTVNPGFGGQKFLPEMLPKIRRLRQLCDARGLSPAIEVDGGQNCESAGQAIEAGANAIVAGSAIFGSPDYAVAIAAIREAQKPSVRKARSLRPRQRTHWKLSPTPRS
jgi:ribulose-phosphate 3-epimerase